MRAGMRVWVLVAYDDDGHIVKVFRYGEKAREALGRFKRVGWENIFLTEEEVDEDSCISEAFLNEAKAVHRDITGRA